jgi:6-phosphogluconolactonase
VTGTVRLVESVPEAFAELVGGVLAATASRGCSLYLSGGGTAAECYRAVAASGADWSSTDIYLGDERCVPPDHEDSNHRMVEETLLAAVGPVRSDHPMYISGSAAESADAYDRLVAASGRPDLVHLGLGPDGHTASLFADSPALLRPGRGRLVAANRDPDGINPYERITLTLAGIARARQVVFTVSGASKRDALARIAGGADLPASRVTAGDVLWLVDPAALGDRTTDATPGVEPGDLR